MLLPRAGADQAANVAEALLAQIRRTMHLGDTDHPVHLTASIGISLVGQDAERSGEAALVNADFAMYQAKHHGRDRAEGAGAPAHAAGTRGPRFR